MTYEQTPSDFPSQSSPPFLLRFRSSQKFILVTVCAATFTDGFVYSAFVPILPLALQDRYGLEPKDTQFWSSALLGIFGGVVLLGSPIVGWICDGQQSRKFMYIFGLVCLTSGIATLVITKHLWVLIISRILHGVSGAVLYTVGLAIIADTVDSKDIGYYMGYALSLMGGGSLLGPVFGSLAFKAAGYMAVVGIMGILAFIDIVLRAIMIEQSTAAKYDLVSTPSTDATEATVLITSTLDLKDADEVKKESFWHTFALLAHPQIATAIYGVFVNVLVMAAFDGVLPLFLSEVFDWTPFSVSLCLLAVGIPDTVLGPIAGWLCDRVGARWLAFSGSVLTAIPLACLQFVNHNSYVQVWLIYILLVLIGTTLPLIFSPLAASLFHTVEKIATAPSLNTDRNSTPRPAYSQSYGLFTCAMAGGTLLGPVLAGFVKETWGWRWMAIVLAAIVASGGIPIYLYIDDTKRGEE